MTGDQASRSASEPRGCLALERTGGGRWFSSLLLSLLCVAAPAGASRAETVSPHDSLSEPCASCHTESTWNELREPLQFDHSVTGFALRFGHAGAQCADCHGSLVFSRVGTACADCHEDPHAGNLGQRCETCHAPKGWENRRTIFDLHSATLFPLTGAHQSADCFACHRDEPSLSFASTPTDCFACHREDYLATRQPDHPRSGFSTRCAGCHSTNSWQGAQFGFGPDFDHDIFFPITGAHRGLDCESCHANGFAGTPTTCIGCHQADYDATVDPNHATAGFPTDCESCHDTQSWLGATFDHDQFFALTGAHRGASCESCHADGLYAGTPTDCVACHRQEYDATTEPQHASAGFSTNCQSCHDTSTWEGAVFNHDTVFALTGAHRATDCEACHINDTFAGTPRDCYACHTNDYNGTTDPNHRAAGFPTACEECHDTTNWNNARFDHDQFFRLDGAHARVSCDSCHADGFAGTPTNCFACHATDYEQTTDPNHRAAGFPTTCEDCHDTSDWENADFDHDKFFPISRGPHSRIACAECHVVPNNFQAFECIECHEHNRNDMNDEHDDVAGYIWESLACYSCHPDGRE